VPPTDAVAGRRRPRGIARQRPGGTPAAKTQARAWRSDGHQGVTSVAAARSGSVSGVPHAAGCWPRKLNVIARHPISSRSATPSVAARGSRSPIWGLRQRVDADPCLEVQPPRAGAPPYRRVAESSWADDSNVVGQRAPCTRSSNASGPSNTATSPTGACATRGRPATLDPHERS